MGQGLEPRWARDCHPDGSGIATQMPPGLQLLWVSDCNMNGFGIATEVWDHIPGELRIATQVGPGLQPQEIWDCNPGGAGIATEMALGRPRCRRRSRRSHCLADSLVTPNAISRTGCSAGTHPAHAGCCGSLLPDPSEGVYLRVLQLPSHYMR